MNPAYLRPVADHLWQSTAFAGVVGLLTLALRTNRARVRHWLWLTASCKFLIPLSVLIALGGQPCLEDNSAENLCRPIHCDGGGKPTVLGSSGLSASLALGAVSSEAVSGSSIGHLDLRIRRYRLFVVDRVAAHPRKGSHWDASADRNADSGTVLSCSLGAGCFRDLPAGPIVATGHLRAINARAVAGRHCA
jgi:hypothetical protein